MSSKRLDGSHSIMKAHIGVDATIRIVHTAGVTTGSLYDANRQLDP